jgi:hypothetical protein
VCYFTSKIAGVVVSFFVCRARGCARAASYERVDVMLTWLGSSCGVLCCVGCYPLPDATAGGREREGGWDGPSAPLTIVHFLGINSSSTPSSSSCGNCSAILARIPRCTELFSCCAPETFSPGVNLRNIVECAGVCGGEKFWMVKKNRATWLALAAIWGYVVSTV